MNRNLQLKTMFMRESLPLQNDKFLFLETSVNNYITATIKIPLNVGQESNNNVRIANNRP